MKKHKGEGIMDRLASVAMFILICGIIVFMFSGGWPIVIGAGLVYAVVHWIITGR